MQSGTQIDLEMLELVCSQMECFLRLGESLLHNAAGLSLYGDPGQSFHDCQRCLLADPEISHVLKSTACRWEATESSVSGSRLVSHLIRLASEETLCHGVLRLTELDSGRQAFLHFQLTLVPKSYLTR